MHRIRIVYSLLSRLISTTHMYLSLLELHAVVTKVKLIHIKAPQALALFNVLYLYIFLVYSFLLKKRVIMGFREDVIIAADTWFNLFICHVLSQLIKAVQHFSRYPYVF